MSPTSDAKSVVPPHPNVPPSPATDAHACFGNVSDTSVYKFDENPWCAAVASPRSMTAAHALSTTDAKTIGVTPTAQINSAVFRAAFTLHPRWIIPDDSHPPAMLPTFAIM